MEIRLRQLARLEAIKIEQELMGLREELMGLYELLNDDGVLKRLLIKEIEADAKKFGDARRTLLEEAQKASVSVAVVDEPITVIVSKNGWVRARTGHQVEVDTLAFKQGDALHDLFMCRSVHNLYALDSKGRVYSVPVSALPGGRGDGVPLATLVDVQDGAILSQYFVGTDDTRLVIATAQGMGFSCVAADLQSRVRAGKAFVNVAKGDAIVKMTAMQDDDLYLACLASDGRLLNFSLVELKELNSGGKGVILMDISEPVHLQDVLPNDGVALLVQLLNRSGKVQELRLAGSSLQAFVAARARKGKVIDAKLKPQGLKRVVTPSLS